MICVQSVSKTSKILCDVLGWRSSHGGDDFDELIDAEGTRALWLHTLSAPEHARFSANSQGNLGRGLALYVFVENLDEVHGRAQQMGLEIVEALAKNPNAGFREFTFRQSDGFHLSVAEPPGW